VEPLGRDSPEAERIDVALRDWRQGDLALDEKRFVYVGDSSLPLSPVAAQAGAGLIQALTSEVDGLAVVTQTCDVVRSCVDRPYVEVAPLVKVEAAELRNVQRGRRPSLAALPQLMPAALAVDLDRVMTVEKAIVAAWTRTPGWIEDSDGRAFARALARKRARPAFPDDFVQLAKRLLDRLTEKHGKSSDEGAALRALREIRVLASPQWNAPKVSLMFWFIREDDCATTGWDLSLDGWLRLIPARGRFERVDGVVVALEDLTAREYVDSDLLDLDHLSGNPP